MAAVKLDLVNQLRALQAKMKAHQELVEVGVDKLEEGKTIRDNKRKEILLKEIKIILGVLHDTDKRLIRNLKSEVFDHIRSISKVEKEVSRVIELVKCSDTKDMNTMNSAVRDVTEQVMSLGMEDMASYFGLSVATQTNNLSSLFQQIPDYVYLRTPSLDPAGWRLENMSHHGIKPDSKYVTVKVTATGKEYKITDLLLNKMTVRVMTSSGEVVEESTLQNKVSRGLSEVVGLNPSCLEVKVKIPLERDSFLAVTLLQTNVGGSPLRLPHIDHEILSRADQTMGPNSTCVNIDMYELDMSRDMSFVPQEVSRIPKSSLQHKQTIHDTMLDQSDYNSLDITNRQQLQKLNSLAPQSMAPYSISKQPLILNPFPKISKQPKLPNMPENLNEENSPSVSASTIDDIPADLTSFSPRSQGTTSTMSGGSQLHRDLQKALDSCPVMLEKEKTLETSFRDDILGGRTNLSIEEVQSRLSSSNGSQEEDLVLRMDSSQANKLHQTDKSVNFAEKTEICQLLATPQIKPGSNKFVLEVGQTKMTDGHGDTSRKIVANQEDETLPFLPSCGRGSKSVLANRSGLSQTAIEDRKSHDCYSVSLLAELLPNLGKEEDPDLMLNTSKSVSPGQEWVSPTSSEWSLGSEAREHNTSILPADMMDGGIQSCSQIQSQMSRPHFYFSSEFEQCGKLEYGETRTKGRGADSPCLAAPCDVTILPEKGLILVTEPPFNRIGIYTADDLKFKDWCVYPCLHGQQQSKKFFYPTSILQTKGFVLILEKHQILILGSDLQPHQPPIKGKFAGLAEDELGDIYTLFQDWKGRVWIQCLRLGPDTRSKNTIHDGKHKFWWHGDQVHLSVMEIFSDWDTRSKCWFLTAKGCKLYITDTGHGKLYIVDLQSGDQSVFGFMGSKDKRLDAPAGLLVDDGGNLLICDSGNNRLVLFSESGQFVRVVDSNKNYTTPFGLTRYNDTVVVVYQGRVSRSLAGMVTYRIKQQEIENGVGDNGSAVA